MHILVCGGAGDIGSHMCKMLVSRGYAVTTFDNLSTGHRDAVRWGEFIEGDLLVPGDIERVLARQSEFSLRITYCQYEKTKGTLSIPIHSRRAARRFR